MKQDRIVLCMKWGTLYSVDYVNVLFNACRRNIKGPFRFICMTDNAEGIVDGVEAMPIPDIGCAPEMVTNGGWPKLAVFAPQIGDITNGRALFIDLDTVICGDLEPFFTHSAPFVGIGVGSNWRPGKVPGGSDVSLGTGVFAFDIGSQVQILHRFQADCWAAFRAAKLEQVWVQEHASSLDYWALDWVISFKRWLRRPIGLDIFLQPKAPPAGVGMVAFHGDPRPAALLTPGNGRWDQFPHFGHGQVTWMADYWTGNGGQLPTTNG